MFTCDFFYYITNKSFNMKRHIARNHDVRLNEKSYDVRLKENFKLFVTGPSRCRKTVFVSKLLENIHHFLILKIGITKKSPVSLKKISWSSRIPLFAYS